MDKERYVAEPNQVLHPGQGRVERYNDANGAVYETTHLDGSGHAFTVNHQLGPAERYGYNYVGADAPQARRTHSQPWAQPAAGAAAAAVGAVGAAEVYHDVASDFVRRNQSDEDDGAAILIALVIAAVVALGPVYVGVRMLRRAKERGTTTTHAKFVFLMEGAWLATLWGWLFNGGAAAWITAASIGTAAVVWYVLTLRGEARWRCEDADDAEALT